MDKILIEKLSALFPDTSKQSLRKWLKHGRVRVNDRVIIKATTPIKDTDQIQVEKKKSNELPFEILFEDDSIIVVLKPAHLLSVASLDPKEPHVHKYLKKAYPHLDIAPLHRLDKEVLGPLIFIKNQKHFDLFKDLFINREIKREYRAIVQHPFQEKEGTIISYLREGKGYVTVSSKDPNEGKKAITHFQVINQNKDYSLLKLNLETGRKNQIRTHLASNGHPILGDVKYGSEMEHIPGIALFAYLLEFTHPITKKKMTFTSPTPPLFQKLLRETKLFASQSISH